MKYLGVPFEHHKLVEWAVPSIQAYKDLHFGTDKTEYSATMAFDEVVDYLYRKGISANYNEPMTLQSIRRMGERKCRAVYNNIQATHNLVNIQQVHGADLEITDTDKYCYIMTYSFPCQDLSNAGLGAGMAKGSGTRSGMLWEVERILRELNGGGATPSASNGYGECAGGSREKQHTTFCRVGCFLGEYRSQMLLGRFERKGLRHTAEPEPLFYGFRAW